MGSEKLSFACYIFSDESSTPFYPSSNGYKKNLFSVSGKQDSDNSRIETFKHGINSIIA